MARSDRYRGQGKSAADAYLAPYLGRRNLTVVTDARVRRLIITEGKCSGVEYTVDGQPMKETAAKR